MLRTLLFVFSILLCSCSDNHREASKDREVAKKVKIGMMPVDVLKDFGKPWNIMILAPDGNIGAEEYTGQKIQDCILAFNYPNQKAKGFTVEFLSARVVSTKDFLAEKERRISISDRTTVNQPTARKSHAE